MNLFLVFFTLSTLCACSATFYCIHQSNTRKYLSFTCRRFCTKYYYLCYNRRQFPYGSRFDIGGNRGVTFPGQIFSSPEIQISGGSFSTPDIQIQGDTLFTPSMQAGGTFEPGFQTFGNGPNPFMPRIPGGTFEGGITGIRGIPRLRGDVGVPGSFDSFPGVNIPGVIGNPGMVIGNPGMGIGDPSVVRGSRGKPIFRPGIGDSSEPLFLNSPRGFGNDFDQPDDDFNNIGGGPFSSIGSIGTPFRGTFPQQDFSIRGQLGPPILPGILGHRRGRRIRPKKSGVY